MAETKKQAPLSSVLSEMAPVRVQGPSSVGQRLADTRDQALSTVGNLTNTFGLPQRMADSIPSGPLQWLIPAQKAAIDARQRLTKRGLSYNQKLIDNVNVPDALESINPIISAPVHYVGKILQNLDVEHEMNLTIDRSQAEQAVGQLPVDIATMSGAGKVAGMVGKSALSAGLGKAAANDALMSFIGKNIPKIEAAGRLGRNAVEGAAISGAHAASKEDATLKDTALNMGVGGAVGPVVGHIADRVLGRKLTSRPMKWNPPARTPIASPGAPVSPVERPNLRLEAPKQTAPVKRQAGLTAKNQPDDVYGGYSIKYPDRADVPARATIYEKGGLKGPGSEHYMEQDPASTLEQLRGFPDFAEEIGGIEQTLVDEFNESRFADQVRFEDFNDAKTILAAVTHRGSRALKQAVQDLMQPNSAYYAHVRWQDLPDIYRVNEIQSDAFQAKKAYLKQFGPEVLKEAGRWEKETIYQAVYDAAQLGKKFFDLPTAIVAAEVSGAGDPTKLPALRYDTSFLGVLKTIGPLQKITDGGKDFFRLHITEGIMQGLALLAAGAGILLGEKDAEAGVADELIVPIIVKALKKGTQKMAMSSGSISMPVDALIKDLLIHVTKDELRLLEIDGVQADKYVDAQYLTPQQDAEIRVALGLEKNTQFKKPVKDLTPAELLQVSAEEVTKKNHLEAVKGTAMDGTADLEINPKQMVKAYQQKVGHLKKEYGKNLTLADVARVTGQPLQRLQGNEVGAGGIGGSSFKPLLAQFKEQLMALDKAKGQSIVATETETARIKKTVGNTINPVVDAVLQQAGTSVKEFAQIIGLSKKNTSQVYAYDPNLLSQALQPDGTYGEELRMIKGKYAVIQHILEDKRLEDAAWVQFADKYNKLTPYEAVKTFESSGDLDTPLYAGLYDDGVHTVMQAANADALDFAVDSVIGGDMVGHTSRTRYIDLENMEAVSTPEGPQILDPVMDYIADIEHIGTGEVITVQMSGAQLTAMDMLGLVHISNTQPFSNLPAAEQAAYTKAKDAYLKQAGLGALGSNAGQAAWQAFVKKVQPILQKHNRALSGNLDKVPLVYGADRLILHLDFLTRKFVKYPQLKDVVVALIERVDKVEVATNEARQMLNYGDDLAKFKQKYPVQAAQYEEVLRVFSIQKEVDPLDRANAIAQITNSLSPVGQQLFGVVQAQVTGMQRDLQTRGLLAIRAHANYAKILNATVKQGVDNFIQGKFFFNNEYVTFDRSGRYQVKINDDQGNLIWHSGHEDRGEATKILQTFEQSMPNGKKGSLQDRKNRGTALERSVGGRIQTKRYHVGAAAPKQVSMDAFAPTAPKDNIAQWNTELMATVQNILTGQAPLYDPRMRTRSLIPGYKVTLETIYKNFVAQATALADMEARATLRNSKDKLLYNLDRSTPVQQVNLSKSLQDDAADMIDMMVNEDPHRQTTFMSDIKAIYAILAFGANFKFVVLQILQEIQMIGQVASRWIKVAPEAYPSASKDLALAWELIKFKADDAKNMVKLVNGLKGLSLFEKQTMNHLINAGQLGAKFLDGFLDAKTGVRKVINDGAMYLAKRAELHNRLVSALTFIRIGQKLGYNTTEQIMPFVKTWMNVAAPSNEKFWLSRAMQSKKKEWQDFKEAAFMFQRFIGEQTNRTVEAFEPLRDAGVKKILGIRTPKKRGGAVVVPPLYWLINAGLQSGTGAITNPLTAWMILGGLTGGAGFGGVFLARHSGEALGIGKESKNTDTLVTQSGQYSNRRNAPYTHEMALASALESVGATPEASGWKGLLYDTQTFGALAASGFNIQKETSPEGYLGSLVPFSWYDRLVKSSASEDNIPAYLERNLMGAGRTVGNFTRLVQGKPMSYIEQGERIGVPSIPLAKSIFATIAQITPNEMSRRQQSYAFTNSETKVKNRLRERLKEDFIQRIEAGSINVPALIDDYERSLVLWNDAIASRYALRPDIMEKLQYDQKSIADFKETLNSINDDRVYNPNNTREGALNKAELFGEKPKFKDILSKYKETGT